jgi:MerR family transcriptional regulator, light-induced transcriptional regulator
MDSSREPTGLRIGVLSKRAGVSAHVLRAWETRYGLFAPARSPGGYRLYTEDDLRRVRRMRAYLLEGLSAAEAARAVLAEAAAQPAERSTEPDSIAVPDGIAEADRSAALRVALDDLDEPAAHVVLDQFFGSLTIEAVVRDVLMPYLHGLGERWRRGEVTVGQEHFASNLIRSRLAAMTAGWDGGRGPRALLACPPGELHDIALLSFGLVLRRSGWRVTYLGADTPVGDLEQTAAAIDPDQVMLSASDPARFDAIRPDLVRLGGRRQVALAGPGASAELASAVLAEYVADDPVTAAQRWASR